MFNKKARQIGELKAALIEIEDLIHEWLNFQDPERNNYISSFWKPSWYMRRRLDEMKKARKEDERKAELRLEVEKILADKRDGTSGWYLKNGGAI